MYCPNCGNFNNDESKFCASCGAPLKSETENGGAGQNQGTAYQPPMGGYRVPIKQRNIAVCILLSIITCGIYNIIWTISIVDDLNAAADRRNDMGGGLVWLLGLVTCGIYTYIWLYTAGEKVGEIRRRNGMTAGSEGLIYLLLALFGFGIVSYAMIQNELNKVATVA